MLLLLLLLLLLHPRWLLLHITPCTRFSLLSPLSTPLFTPPTAPPPGVTAAATDEDKFTMMTAQRGIWYYIDAVSAWRPPSEIL